MYLIRTTQCKSLYIQSIYHCNQGHHVLALFSIYHQFVNLLIPILSQNPKTTYPIINLDDIYLDISESTDIASNQLCLDM